MKFRNGFVSNSSSSSFICCLAKVADMAMLNKYLGDRLESIAILNNDRPFVMQGDYVNLYKFGDSWSNPRYRKENGPWTDFKEDIGEDDKGKILYLLVNEQDYDSIGGLEMGDDFLIIEWYRSVEPEGRELRKNIDDATEIDVSMGNLYNFLKDSGCCSQFKGKFGEAFL